MERMQYTDKELTRFYLQDLIVDIRCADQKGTPEFTEYAEKCRKEFKKLWPKRHSPKINRYGIPKA